MLRVHDEYRDHPNILIMRESAHNDDSRHARRRRNHISIVRRAEERFWKAGGRRVSIADLCAATGVSANTLNVAFRQLRGETPLRYFKLRRFYHARQLLFRAQDERAAVKRAALEVGLTHLGRFSVEYLRLFGETPSATLRRGRQSSRFDSGALDSGVRGRRQPLNNKSPMQANAEYNVQVAD